jgi:hypothetical protein
MQSLARAHSFAGEARLLSTRQTTQYSGELDAGFWQTGVLPSYTVLNSGQYSGTSNVDLAYLTRTDISFNSASKEIRCTGQMGVFLAAGGETIVVIGSHYNFGVYTTISATADKVVVSQSLVDETAGYNVSLIKREALSNVCVKDNRTGLMWLQKCSSKQGVAGNGKMPWTGQIYDIYDYCRAVNAARVGGYTDWRIPDINECESITKYQVPASLPDSVAFPSWPSDQGGWSSNIYTLDISQRLAMNFNTGQPAPLSIASARYAPLVRLGTSKKLTVISVLGESISQATNPATWPHGLGISYLSGATNLKDHAASGASIIADLDTQVVAAAGDEATIIILALGVNDNEGGDMAALQAKVETNILALKTSNPTATLYYMNILPQWTDSGGGTPIDNSLKRAAILAACTAKSITCWDTYTTPWITAAQTIDGLHPLALGHSSIVAQILSRLP